MIKAGTPIRVVWEDAFHSAASDHCSVEEAAQLETIMETSMGFCMIDDPKRLVFAMSFHVADGRTEYRDIMSVPRGMVRKVVRL